MDKPAHWREVNQKVVVAVSMATWGTCLCTIFPCLAMGYSLRAPMMMMMMDYGLWMWEGLELPTREELLAEEGDTHRRSWQPGNDGSRPLTRFQRVAYPELPNNTAIRALVVTACLHALDVKDSSPSATETVVREMLSKKHADFTGPYASREQRAAAPFLPTSFKQALTQLQDVGGCRWPRLIRYDMCPCGFIYRGPEYWGADHCGGMVPGPRAGEWIACPKMRSEARYLTYNPIGGFCGRVFSNKQLAEEFSSWQSPDRMRRNGQLRDICDAAVVQELLASDPRFRDPRCLVTMIASDAFVVPADEQERSSTAWLLLVVNAPPEKRYLLGYCTILCVTAGNVKPTGQKQAEYFDPNHTLLLITDDLLTLITEGVVVTDARTGEEFPLYVANVGLVMDYKGFQKHLGLKGTPSPSGCFKCCAVGHRVGTKTVWCNHHRWLSPGHPWRTDVADLHRLATACGTDEGPPPFRTRQELTAGVQEPPAVKAALAANAGVHHGDGGGPSHGTDDFAGDVSEEEVEADEEPASGRGRQHARELEEELPGGRRSRGRGRTGRDRGRGSRGAVTANTRGAGVARRGRRGRSPVNAVRGNAVGQPGVIAGDVSEEEVEADEEPASGRGRQHARELEEELPGGRRSRGRGRTGRDGGRGSRGAVTANTRGAGVARRGRRGRSPVNAVRGNAVGQPGAAKLLVPGRPELRGNTRMTHKPIQRTSNDSQTLMWRHL
ncbi:hypothetical protein VOLCADRAFT_103398 [Volvox carteri f. nagariensis]|uniref:Uncharacterized protein n=1 Tax=Volvox carteri f. nagariensis TaxID=3068 RepID=D8TLL1_VOLCA|nr:uncharacterized protein VOLCADRAFT_103398 [Volvox carteri f. nagariensis]EFJ51754.1 hypothetical protein VOLCADRAFT_103398 [Volvox carteri f. nagariensis]|eukprot:XP_002947164.1 hypothetical protein VOLCADRAFT_103398 [Volvox carteri f. nagariensis]